MTQALIDNPVDIPNLTDQRTFVDGVPFEAFDTIRALPGLYWQPTDVGTTRGGFWVLTRTQDCVAVEADPETFSSARGVLWPYTNLPEDHPFIDYLMYKDPPEHSAMRRPLASAFGPRVVANFDPWIREIVTDAIDDMVASDGPFDYVQKVASIVPARVIGRVMGMPKTDEPLIIDSTTKMFAAVQMGVGDEGAQAVAAELGRLTSYVTDVLIPLKRREPADDMCSALTRALDAGSLTLGQCQLLHQLLINAGFETTHTLIGQSMRLIVEDADIAEKTFRAIDDVGPDRVIDEFLRYITPAMNFARTATKDTELAGQAIQEGDLLMMWYVAANRDPETFENPHTFDPWRDEPGALAFGSGHHRCIGAALARLELRILFEEMTRRKVTLELAGEPKRGWSTFINQLTALPVKLTSGA